MRHKAKWEGRFLAELRCHGNVRRACEAVDIARKTAYHYRNEFPDFRAAWKSALDDAVDTLEAEAWRRGRDGVDEPVVYQGELSGIWLGPDGVPLLEGAAKPPGSRFIPLTVKKFSDTVLLALLKAHSKRFRDIQRHEHSGPKGGPMRYKQDGTPWDGATVEELRELRDLQDRIAARLARQANPESASGAEEPE